MENTATSTMEDTMLEAKVEKPVQLVAINEETNQVELNQELLNELFDPIPHDMPVAILSVVGAFRSGKSLLMDFFLRFLRYYEMNYETVTASSLEDIPEWIFTQGNVLEGDSSDADSKTKGFSWRNGKDRETLGMWVWNKAFLIRNPKDQNNQIAVILMDTQGMFDGETNQMMTTCIFGLATLLSSYQIYNIDKRLQEDILQHLALFSEYSRVVYTQDREEMDKLKSKSFLAVQNNNETSPKKEEEEKKEEDPKQLNEASLQLLHSESLKGIKVVNPPFQKIEFLIRDWQNYSDEDDTALCFKESKEYVTKFMDKRAEMDLLSTRMQIQRCYQSVGCFCLPHPGIAITKPHFKGELNKFETSFLRLMGHFIESIIFDTIQPKIINNYVIKSAELKECFTAYCTVFVEGYQFPQALTLLSATAEVNNHAAYNDALLSYKENMMKKVNNEVGYVDENELYDLHIKNYYDAIKVYYSRANLGNTEAIECTYKKLVESIEDEYLRFRNENKLRDPLAFIDEYLFPLLMLVLSVFIEFFFYYTCFSFSSTCRTTYDFFSLLTSACVLFLLGITYKKMKPLYDYVLKIIRSILSELTVDAKKKKN